MRWPQSMKKICLTLSILTVTTFSIPMTNLAYAQQTDVADKAQDNASTDRIKPEDIKRATDKINTLETFSKNEKRKLRAHFTGIYNRQELNDFLYKIAKLDKKNQRYLKHHAKTNKSLIKEKEALLSDDNHKSANSSHQNLNTNIKGSAIKEAESKIKKSSSDHQSIKNTSQPDQFKDKNLSNHDVNNAEMPPDKKNDKETDKALKKSLIQFKDTAGQQSTITKLQEVAFSNLSSPIHHHVIPYTLIFTTFHKINDNI